MIDTVVLRLHDLNQHRFVCNHLIKMKGNRKDTFVKFFDIEDLQGFSGQKQAEMIKYGDSGKLMLKDSRGQKHIKSSHYFLAYSLNREKDFIEFNFSIPKYLYGTNIAQFVTHPQYRDFVLFRHKEIQFQSKFLYDRFIKFLEKFFEKEFGYLEPEKRIINYDELELVRIDLCFNQVFNSKEDAMGYLNAQKLINKKHQRQNSDLMDNYQTGISYRGENFSFKIYHKGSEYSKNDKKQHIKLNKDLNLEKSKLEEDPNSFLLNNEFDVKYKSPDLNQRFKNELMARGYTDKEIAEARTDPNYRYNYFDTEYLQKFSDRILRYEITIRNSYMSNIYKRKVFKKSNEIYQEELKKYRELHSKTKSGSELVKIDQEDRTFYKTFKKSLQKSHRFYPFFKKYDADDFNEVTIFSEINTAWSIKQPFTKTLLNELLKDFWKRVKDFQPNETPSKHELLRKVDDVNNTAKRKRERFSDVKKQFPPNKMAGATGMSKTSIALVMDLLDKHGSFDAIRKSGDYDRTTVYRWKKKFEKLGYNDKAVKNFIPIIVKNDFEEYYNEIILSGKRVFQNKNL